MNYDIAPATCSETFQHCPHSMQVEQKQNNERGGCGGKNRWTLKPGWAPVMIPACLRLLEFLREKTSQRLINSTYTSNDSSYI